MFDINYINFKYLKSGDFRTVNWGIDLKDDNQDLLLDSIVGLIEEGLYTKEEVEELFKIKVPFEIYPTKKNGFYFKTKRGDLPDYDGWAKFIVDEYKFFSNTGASYIYDKDLKHYKTVSQLELENILETTTNGKARPQHYNNFLKKLLASQFKSKNDFKSRTGLLNLSNGILNVSTRELIPSSYEYFFEYCLPISYNSSSTCNEWMSFLDRIFPENGEFKIIMAQIFGYILYGGDQWLHKAFVLYGEGRNGKSTLLHILQKLIGRHNFSTVSLSNLDKPFSVVNLDGKIANIIGETPNDKINAEIFKEATSGGLLTGSKKYKDEYVFECSARFVFACNELPKFGENTIGMQERLYFIPFKQYFDKKDRNGSIKSVLEKEMSGILNWALSGLELLLDSGSLPETDASSQLLDEYNVENDSVYAWACECIEIDKSPSSRYSSKYFYNIYKSSISNSGRHPVSDHTFAKRFKKYLRSRDWFNEKEMFNAKDKTYIGVRSSSKDNSIISISEYNSMSH